MRVAEAKAGIGSGFRFYNEGAAQDVGYRTPTASLYGGMPVDMWTIGFRRPVRFPRSLSTLETRNARLCPHRHSRLTETGSRGGGQKSGGEKKKIGGYTLEIAARHCVACSGPPHL